MRKTVRNFKSNATHLADLNEKQIVPAHAFGASYTAPVASAKTLCGVVLSDGVVMHSTVGVTCKTCRMLAEHIRDFEDSADPVSLVEQTVRRALRESVWLVDIHPDDVKALGDEVVAALREIEPS